MSTPSRTAEAPTSATKPFCPIEQIKPFLTPYYLTVAGVLGAVTVVFAVVIALIVIVTVNFNVLGWME